MENRTMKKTLIAITIIASMTFASTGKLKNPKGLYPNKKPLISKTTTAVSVNSDDVRSLKVRKHISKVKKLKAVSSIDRPKRLRRFSTKRGR